MAAKAIGSILRSADRHWVGNGFPVRTLFAYTDGGDALSPFLLLDYAGPAEFQPTSARRGVGEHPHRGFETVTIVYHGEVEHRDSSGGGGRIGPGDVQWMTAAGGLVHEEFHGREFARTGGLFEMVQLWVNLPAKDKKAPPRYQGITSDTIPTVRVDGATVRVIAGTLAGATGPAKTFTPIDVWDVRLPAGAQTRLAVADGHTTALVVLHGAMRANGADVRAAEVALFERAGADVTLDATEDAIALLLSGRPLDEPIVGQGPFVMNTVGDIKQAMIDYQSGRMGHLD
jgi:quercetin 2,3-dioxygenase